MPFSVAPIEAGVECLELDRTILRSRLGNDRLEFSIGVSDN